MASTKPTNPPMKGWKIWYSDSTATSDEFEWTDCSDVDVQYVNIYYERKRKDDTDWFERRIMHGANFYSKDGEEFYQSDKKGGMKGHIKDGGFTDDQNLERIRQESWNDYGEWLL